MRLIVYLCFIFSLISGLGISQVSIEWVGRYNNGYSGDIGIAITSDDSGNAYVTGFSYRSWTRYDLIVIKYSPGGTTEWVRREVNSNSTSGSDIVVDKHYNVYVAGNGLFKYDSQGNPLWNSPTPTNGRFNSLAVDDSGNAYVTGSMNGGFYFITKKISVDGVIRWERTYNNLNYNAGTDLVLDNNGNIIITGPNSGTENSYDFVTIKYSNNGDQVWLRRFNGGNDDFPYGLAVDDSNNVYVTGWNSNSTTDALTIKYSPSGDTIWKAIYDGGGGDIGYSIEVDSLGCVYIAGITFSNDYLTLKYDNPGNLIWARIQPGEQIPYHPVIKIDKYRNVYMSYVTLRTGNYSNYAVVKYDNNGAMDWIAEYNYGGVSLNFVYDLALDNDANVYVTGRSGGSMATVKFIQNPTSINPIVNLNPAEYKLEQNFPNPFNPVTKISFEIPVSGNVKIRIYDIVGRELTTLVNETKQAGRHETIFDAQNFQSGLYLYKIEAGSFMETKRMLLIK